jgi:hypothetical protein
VQPSGAIAESPPTQPATPVANGPTDPLDQILVDWEAATSKIRRLDCEFSRFRYDRTFEVEKRGEGRIAIDRRGLARIELVGAPLPQGRAGQRNKGGVPFALKAEDAETWHWTGPHLYRIDDKAKTYEVVDVPANRRIRFFFSDVDVWHFFWAKPFLLGMPTAELKEQFNITLLSDKPDDEVWLKLIPRRKEGAVFYESAVLILDRSTWLSKAIKTRDVIGSETVQVFKNVAVNSSLKAFAIDLSKPNLEGCQRLGVAAPSGTQPSK